ncbi:T-kininogen 2-like [Hyla sarda]|uniref:T-kininogen 2-like n=1 Tax=Hyla sarda TaxID=327740 RepID=UPI0024C46285|nr:T-kininogen 2-like [Hyla sarda]
MRLLPIALLFSYCFIGSANQGGADNADCNDQTVFQAADEVLRSLNDAKEDGNQFALYRITEAAKKEESGRVTFFITFEMQETVCGVKNGIYWQRCAFKANEADFGECSAHVLVNTETNSKKVIWQNCFTAKGWQPKTPKILVLEPTVSVVQRSLLGSYHIIDTKSEMLLPIIQSAIEKMNRVGNHQFHFDLENFAKAEQQVVSGWNYILEYKIRQTNCSRNVFPKWSPAECSLDKNGQDGNCITRVFVTPNEEIKDIFLNCHSSTGFCLSCPDAVEATDPELLYLLKQFIEEYNSDSNHTNLYKVQNIETATRKLVQNKKQYTAMFRIQETNCSKSNPNIMGAECDIQPMGSNLSCEASINVADETVNVLQDYRCNPFLEGNVMNIRTSIKGLSPLRSVPILAVPQRRVARSSKHKGKERHGKNGKEPKKDKKDKEGKKHKDKHDHSSEESAEENRHQPQRLPRPPQNIPRVPEIDTSVLVATTQQVNPTNTDKVVGPPSTQLPTLLIPHLSQSSPLKPTVQDQQETYPNINETVTLDLPVLSPEYTPKCPGKLWQPLLPILQITTDKPFVIKGVSFNDDDLLL